MVITSSTLTSAPRIQGSLTKSRPSAPTVASDISNTAKVQGSAVAEAKSSPAKAAVDWDYYLSFTNIGISQEEFRRVTTEGGRKLSESQGLPEGHYDFSKMTRSELNVAVNDMIANNRAPDSVINGLAAMLTVMPEEPTNMLKQASSDIEYESSQKNTPISDILQAALSFMTSEQALFDGMNESNQTKAAISYQRISAS